MTHRKSSDCLAGWRRRALFGAAVVFAAGSLAALSTEGRADGIKRGASCGLGKFEPYVEPAGDEAAKDNDKLEPM